jgi:Rieske Fe-S protein
VSDDNRTPPAALNRRAVLAVGGVAGASAALLAAAGCASYSTGGQQAAAPSPAAGAPSPPPAGGSAGQQGGAGTSLGPSNAVPVGGGTVFTNQKVVVTQPTAGTFHAFSAICTHQGCTVNSVSGGTINCPCHGSKFHITDGSVANGPAKRPLPAKQVTAEGGQLRLT